MNQITMTPFLCLLVFSIGVKQFILRQYEIFCFCNGGNKLANVSNYQVKKTSYFVTTSKGLYL